MVMEDKSTKPLATIGIIADVQYADKDDADGRAYRLSLSRLTAAVRAFNSASPALDGVLHLGDIIDGNASAQVTLADFGAVVRAFARLRTPCWHVVGNHCLEVGRDVLLSALRTRAYYTAELRGGWQLVVIDTTDVGVRGASAELIGEAHAFLTQHAGKLAYAEPYNGGVGREQLRWLRQQLVSCRSRGVRALVAGHMPLWVEASNADAVAFNDEEIAQLLDEFADVVPLYMCGHWHAGGYARKPSGVHHWTCEAMVEAGAQAAGHAALSVFHDRIEVVSADKAAGIKSRTLPFDAPTGELG
jgi:3',5'-cyclic AMP phosphodiesterase CpdA